MIEHELRRQVVGEMHLRRWPVLHVPCLVIQYVLTVDAGEREAEAAHLPGSDTAAAHRSGTLESGARWMWERHSEGSTLALFVDDYDAASYPAAPAESTAAAAMDWANALPGRVICATKALVLANEAEAERVIDRLDFERGETVSCHLSGGPRMWSDFRLKDDGFGEVVVAANNANARDLTRIVQRLQELGNYRNRALLGLPAAQSAWPRLDAAEARLTDLAERVAADTETDDALMEKLSALSSELSAISTATNYRLSATAAYAKLVEERLAQLNVGKIESYASLIDFTQRRFLPAQRTCAAVTERERQLSERADHLTSLLRARISTRIENQNGRLLRSMERSATMQLRLQQLVEGLSVVALSYYLVGLLGYVLHGFAARDAGFDVDLVLAIMVLPIVLAVWLALKGAKTRLLGEKAEPPPA